MLHPLWARESRKRPRGGWRQRLERGELEHDEDVHISKLTAGHLLDWADGVTSAAKVERVFDNVRENSRWNNTIVWNV